MAKFHTRRRTVEAVQWGGNNPQEVEALDPDHIAYYRHTNSFLIDTPETPTFCDNVRVGDYIVKREDGTLVRRTQEEFYAEYEAVAEGEIEERVTAVQLGIAAEIEETERRGDWHAEPKSPLGNPKAI